MGMRYTLAEFSRRHDVLGQAEDRRALLRVVAADPLEDAGPVVERVAQHVDGGLLEVDELAVLPDPADTGEGVGHRRPPLGGHEGNDDASPNGRGGSISDSGFWLRDSGGSRQRPGGAHQGGGLQAQHALAQSPTARQPAARSSPALRGRPAPLGADQEAPPAAPRADLSPSRRGRISRSRPRCPGTSGRRGRRRARTTSLQAWGPVISGRRERWHCSRAAAATRRRRSRVPLAEARAAPARC